MHRNRTVGGASVRIEVHLRAGWGPSSGISKGSGGGGVGSTTGQDWRVFLKMYLFFLNVTLERNFLKVQGVPDPRPLVSLLPGSLPPSFTPGLRY